MRDKANQSPMEDKEHIEDLVCALPFLLIDSSGNTSIICINWDDGVARSVSPSQAVAIKHLVELLPVSEHIRRLCDRDAAHIIEMVIRTLHLPVGLARLIQRFIQEEGKRNPKLVYRTLLPSRQSDLAALRHGGFLISHSELLNAVRRPDSREHMPQQIDSICIPTRNRPGDLRECVTKLSHWSEFEDFGCVSTKSHDPRTGTGLQA